jgi:hypothetical protein
MALVLLAWPAAAQSATGPLPPLAPPDALLPPTFWEQHGTLLIAAAFGLTALVAAVLWFVLKSPPPAAAAPPAVLAREMLTRLRGRPEDGRVLGEISQALRRYFIAVLDLPRQELTTSEFAAALAGHGGISAALAEAAASFLRECDERKFAPVTADAPLNAADRALAMVAEMEQQRAPAEGTPAIP